jgi:hypothetical protein
MSIKDIASKADLGRKHSEDRGADPHLLGRKSVLMGILTSGFVIANVAQPSAVASGTVKPSPITSTPPAYTQKWTPSTAYVRGQQVVSPNNDIVSAKLAHTSSAAYASDMLNWDLSRTYVPAVMTEGAGIDPTGATVSAGLQTVINRAMLNDPQGFRMPAGLFKLTAPLNFPFSPYSRLGGAGSELTILRQTTAGQPVMKFGTDLTHSVNIENLTLDFATPQTNTGSIGILYDDGAGLGQGFFNHHYCNMTIRNTYRGLAVADAAGAQTVWNLWCENMHFIQTKNSAVFMRPSTSIGVPQVVFSGTEINNCGTGLVSTGPAFDLSGVELTLNNLDIEGWHNEIITSDSGNILIRGLHVEHHLWSHPYASAFIFANGALVIDGFNLHGDTTAGCTDAVYMVQADVNAKLTLINGDYDVDCALGGSYLRELVYCGGDSSATLTVANVHKGVTNPGGDLNMPGEGNADPRHALTGVGLLPGGLRGVQLGSGVLTFGAGTPEGVVTARVGSLYVRSDGGASTTLYVKQAGTGKTGWVGK